MDGEDTHQALKRWEKARQMQGLDKEPELAGPAAWCRFKPLLPMPVSRLPVFILQIFEKDLVCVKACHEPVPAGVPATTWLVAGGIAWMEYLPGIVRHYEAALPVPKPFTPLRKLGSPLLERLRMLPPRELPAVFLELRRAALLPPLLPLAKATCPPPLVWETLQKTFQDFRGEAAGAAHG